MLDRTGTTMEFLMQISYTCSMTSHDNVQEGARSLAEIKLNMHKLMLDHTGITKVACLAALMT